MATPYIQMTIEETNKFQVLIAHYRAMRLAKWQAVQATELFVAEMNAMNTLGSELEAPAEAIPHDSRQDAVSIFATDPSWNELINEKAFAGTFLTAELGATFLGMYRAAIGADVVA